MKLCRYCGAPAAWTIAARGDLDPPNVCDEDDCVARGQARVPSFDAPLPPPVPQASDAGPLFAARTT